MILGQNYLGTQRTTESSVTISHLASVCNNSLTTSPLTPVLNVGAPSTPQKELVQTHMIWQNGIHAHTTQLFEILQRPPFRLGHHWVHPREGAKSPMEQWITELQKTPLIKSHEMTQGDDIFFIYLSGLGSKKNIEF